MNAGRSPILTPRYFVTKGRGEVSFTGDLQFAAFFGTVIFFPSALALLSALTVALPVTATAATPAGRKVSVTRDSLGRVAKVDNLAGSGAAALPSKSTSSFFYDCSAVEGSLVGGGTVSEYVVTLSLAGSK